MVVMFLWFMSPWKISFSFTSSCSRKGHEDNLEMSLQLKKNKRKQALQPEVGKKEERK